MQICLNNVISKCHWAETCGLMEFFFLISQKLTFERLTHLWRTDWAHHSESRDLIPALSPLLKPSPQNCSALAGPDCPPAEGGALPVLLIAVSQCQPAHGSCSLNTCLMNERRNQRCHTPTHRQDLNSRARAPVTKRGSLRPLGSAHTSGLFNGMTPVRRGNWSFPEPAC